MRVGDVMAHFREVGTWVDWDNTCDQVMHGSEDAEVNGIATAWIASDEAVRRAAEQGLNLFISHEGLFYDPQAAHPTHEEVFARRREMLDELGMTVVRCHDTWDRMPEVGIPDAWADWLGFETEPRDPLSFYKICLTGGMPLDRVAAAVAARCAELGQEAVFTVGDGTRLVDRMAVGTGAITRLTAMHDELEPDLIVMTDDGSSWTRDVMWAIGMDVALIVVTHPVSELPGMMRMAQYLGEQFPRVPVRYVAIEFPRTVWGG